MAAYVKILDFVEQLCSGKHDFTAGGNAFYAVLLRSTDAPVQTDTLFADWTAQPTGTGYTAGGADSQNTLAETTGTATVTGTKVTWTATAADWISFRYVGLYNFSQTTPLKPLVAYWDYGLDLTLGNGESFSVKWSGSDTTGTIFTLV